MFMLLTFVIGIILRLTENGRNEARIILAYSLFGFYFRLLHVFTISRHIGPIVLMVGRMVSCMDGFNHVHVIFKLERVTITNYLSL